MNYEVLTNSSKRTFNLMSKKLLSVLTIASALLAVSFSANAQYSILYSFNDTDGANPYGDVSLWNGLLYGMTSDGGTNGGGTVFYADTNGSNLSDVYNFASAQPGGTYPTGNLIRGGNKLYGMTNNGGKYYAGCVFSVDTNGSNYQDLWDFNDNNTSNGAYPYGSLTLLGGKLYGMTEYGGINGNGNIFSIDTTGANYTDMYDFSSGEQGAYPYASSLLFLKGKFYSMTSGGGANGYGNVFSIDTNGNNYQDLWDFQYASGSNGAYPFGSLITSNGTLYGMTYEGGADYSGNVFSIDTTGNNYTDLWDFQYYSGTNGAYPYGDLSFSGNKLFGMTAYGGLNENGNIFSIDTTGGNYVDLYDFDDNSGMGAYPYGNLTLAGNKLYGMTYEGANNNDGAIFSIDTTGADPNLLYSFGATDTDGTYPDLASLILSNGNLYGMTEYGGDYNGEGTIISIDTNGSNYAKLYSFGKGDSSGSIPYADLIRIGNKVYGTTEYGGFNGQGSVFSMDTNGANYKDLWDFKDTGSTVGNSNGEYPICTLVLAGGRLYGTTDQGGAYGSGVIFSIDSNGNGYKDLWDFDNNGSSNGAYPEGALTLLGGKFYGITNSGGIDDEGNIFSIDTNGSNYTDLYDFTNNEYPQYGSLTYSAGKFYGMAEQGGANGAGYVFCMDSSGANFKDLWDFDNNGSSNGAYPDNVTVKISGAVLFGMTESGGPDYGGNIFSLDTNGTNYTDLYNLGYGTGDLPRGALTLSGNAAYGMAEENGIPNLNGVIFKDVLISDSTTDTNVSCNGGNNGHATVYVVGGTSPFTYMWSNGRTNDTIASLSAGTYSVSVTDYADLTVTASITITQPRELRDSVTINGTITCNGDSVSATANVAGGTSPYTYLWSDPQSQTNATATGLSAGTYNVSIQDSCGADSVVTITITQPNPLGNVIASVVSNVSCNAGSNGSATVNPSGGTTPYIYMWSDASSQSTQTAVGLSAGTYTVSVTDACGADSVSVAITITQPGILGNVIASVTSNVTCNGSATGSASVSPSGGGTPYTYMWSNGEATATATGLSAGTYSVSVQDSCGADSMSAIITITQPNQLGNVIASVVSNLTCNGVNTGSATVTSPSGGNTPYTYLWSNGETTANATALSAGTYNVSIMDACGADSVSATITITQPSQLGNVIASVVSNVTCNGSSSGIATVTTPSGGNTPYTYLWSDASSQSTVTATGLSAGTYNVSVMDACGADSVSATITITQPSALSYSISVSNINCAGGLGSATANVSGGNSPYIYLWSDANSQTTATATGLSAGTYSVSIQDACSADSIATITINSASQLGNVIASVISNVTCNGSANGSATVNPSGGGTPYTYMWSNGEAAATATGLSAGTYNVSVTDACSADSISVAITITQPSQLGNVIASVVSNVTCNGSSSGIATVTTPSGGNTPYTYMWSDANSQSTATATGLSAGTYNVSVMDACGADSVSATITITQPSALSYSISVSNINCAGGLGSATANVSGGNSPYIYLWSDANSQTTATATGLSAGTYSVSIQDACSADSIATITINSASQLGNVIASVISNVTCNGSANGSATVNPSGGGTPYTYMWSNGESAATATGLSAGTYNVSVTDACSADSISVAITITQPNQLGDVLASVVSNVTCNGSSSGIATVTTPSGGNTPYTYMWSDASSQSTQTATGLSAGTYNVSVMDACGADSVSATITITQPSQLGNTSVTVLSNVTCNGSTGGSASVNPSGGNSPYTYLWSDANSQTTATATGLAAGTYTVSIMDACGADSMSVAVITQPAMLSNTGVTVISETCAGDSNGSASVSPAGGTTPYTYLWSDANSQTTATATGLAAGTYSVSIMDACGADSISTVTITAPATLTVTVFAGDVRCNGEDDGTAHAHAHGGSFPFTYDWSNGGTTGTISGLSAGTYSVSVTDACGSLETATVTITQPTAITYTTYEQNNNGTGNGIAAVNVSGGTSPYTYLWTPGGQTTDSISNQTGGTYCCAITDRHGCVDTACITIGTLGIDNISSSSGGINIYPDPTIGNFTVAGVSAGQVIEMYNYLGEKLSSTTVSNNTTMHFDISNQANGIYLIRILNSDGSLVTEKKMVKTQ